LELFLGESHFFLPYDNEKISIYVENDEYYAELEEIFRPKEKIRIIKENGGEDLFLVLRCCYDPTINKTFVHLQKIN
jgi:hypothetical protein